MGAKNQLIFFEREGTRIFSGAVEELYGIWEPPMLIIVDGPYGISGFEGDSRTPNELPEWYEPHIKAWTEKGTPQTHLWFWNTEIGWAKVHTLLEKYGWEYKECCIWDKGIGHIAGNCNIKTLRRLPTITEVCAHYVKRAFFKIGTRKAEMKEWLRHEWIRTGLPLYKANEACGVKNAATRKYLTACHLWYPPPPEIFEKLVRYANKYGNLSRKPYFSIDGKEPLDSAAWASLRPKFYCMPGITNVWSEPPVRGKERIKTGTKSVHANQKPLKLIETIIRLCSDRNDVIWEPFGGTCTTAIASHKLKRRCRSAEILKEFYGIAISRLATYDIY